MSSNSVISSGESERRWVVAMEKNFPSNHILDIDFNTPFCVVKVPKTLSEEKPEAYAPQRIGLGPLHHLRPHLYPMHNHKLATITRFLAPEKLVDFHLAVERLLPLEPLVRACYDQYLDLDMVTLAWIFAIDGLYLLLFLKNYPEMKQKQLAGDVLMLENQIPLVVLDEIRQIFQLSTDHDFQAFFLMDQSPLQLNTNGPAGSKDAHLLHRMYHLTVGKRIVPHIRTVRTTLDEIIESVQFLACLPGAATAGQILSFVNKVPLEKILALFKKNQRPAADKIDIPSVSQMTKIAKIKFTLTSRGIKGITFDKKEKEFYLPSIRVKSTTEILLRNMVAYEAATAEAGEKEMAEYVDLMCGLIDSVEDVEILKEKGIVESQLDKAEIARMFNDIRKSEKKGGGGTNIAKAIKGVNREYSNTVRVKVEKYASACFKFSSVVITIAVLIVLTLKAFCSVFGCGRWFDISDSIQTVSPMVSMK